jgi:hypothetical protein
MKLFLLIAAIVFGLCLALPLVQMSTGWPPDAALAGVEVAVQPPEPAVAAWWAGGYQSAFDSWLDQCIGLRGVMVKTANQMSYTLFGELAEGKGTRVVPGRQGYFYEQSYVDAFHKASRHSAEELDAAVGQVRQLQDRLEAAGIAFLLVIAPSKAEIYPEFLPAGADVEGRPQRQTAYEGMIDLFHQSGVHVLDAHALFKQWRADPTEPPLFTKGGTHWNHYGASRVIAILMQQLAAQTGQPLPSVKVMGHSPSDRIIRPDNDLGELANLWQSKSLAGPQVLPEVEIDEGGVKPDILFICDSFGAMLVDMMQAGRLFRQQDTYFYNRRHMSWPRRRSSGDGEPDAPGVLDRLAGRDAVVIVQVEVFLPKIGFGFVTNALEAFGAMDVGVLAGRRP